MTDYYVLDNVREQVLAKGRFDFASVSGTFPTDWYYCPCIILNQCVTRNNMCQVKLGIFFNNPNIGIAILDIIFIRNKQNGFIRVNNMKLNQLIEKKVIDKTALKIVSI